MENFSEAAAVLAAAAAEKGNFKRGNQETRKKGDLEKAR